MLRALVAKSLWRQTVRASTLTDVGGAALGGAMGRVRRLLGRLRRRPVDPERALERSCAEAARRAVHDDVHRELGRGLGGGGF